MTNGGGRRDRLRAEHETARTLFHAALAATPPDAWRAPSRNPGWTNAQLFFHVVLGFILVLPLMRIMHWMQRLPAWCDRAFARALDAATPLFNRVNALGPRLGARLYSREALGRKFDRVHARILRRLARLAETDFDERMRYPTRWDPRFHDVMSVEDLLRYPVAHLRHHLAQLSAPAR